MKIRLLVVLCAGLAVPVWARPFTGRVVNRDNKPVAGARVEVFAVGKRNAPPLQQTQSDANGAFTVDVPDDETDFRTLQIEVPGAGVLTGVAFGSSPTEWKIAPAATLSGTVVDDNDLPVSDALISVAYLAQNHRYLGDVHHVETRSDAQGRWTLSGLPQGYDVNCQVRAAGKALARFEAFVEERSAPFPAVKLRGGFDVRGVVRDDKGAVVPGVQIYSTSDGQNGATSDDRGEFSISNLALQAQDVHVQTERPELFPPGNVRVSPEQPVVSIQLKRGVPISGRFVDSVTKKPVTDVAFSLDAMSSEKYNLKPDATGRFQVFAPTDAKQMSLRVDGPFYMHDDEFLDGTKIALGDIGDIALTRGSVWKGKMTLDGKAPGENVFFNLTRKTPIPLTEENIEQARQDGRKAAPYFPTTQIQADRNGDFQSLPLLPGEWKFDTSQWMFQPVAPLSVVLPAPSDAPLVRDVAVQKIAAQIVKGRLQTRDGAPVPYAVVQLASGNRATTRGDGSWQTSVTASEQQPAIKRVSLGEQTLLDPQSKAQREGDSWTFAPLEWNDGQREVSVVVRDEAGRAVAGAQVLAMFNGQFKVALADQTGIARFKLAPGNFRFFAANGLDFGEATSDANAPLVIELRSPRTQDALPKAQAILAGETNVSLLLQHWHELGAGRLREVALKGDGANPGRSYGEYLSALLAYEPKNAFAEIPFVEALKTPARDLPFELRQAEQTLALRAARSDDEGAKAWARRWLAAAQRDFGAPVELKTDWAGGDQTSRFLALYAVATALKDPLARSFFDAAIDALPVTDNNKQSYSYPEYFSIDDPNLGEFRSALPLVSQVDFAASSAFRSQIETPAQARQGLAQLEAVVALPAIRAKVPADSLARSLDWARFQTLGLLLKDPQLPLRPVLEQLRALNSTYAAGNVALAGAQFALDRGDKTLAREFFQLARERGWISEGSAFFETGETKTAARLQTLSAAFPDLAPKEKIVADISLVRAQALTNLREGDREMGNAVPDAGGDARRLRALDPALGRLILEARWAGLGPINENNKYTAVAVASAMELYDLARAFDWLSALAPKSYQAHNERLTAAAKLVTAPQAARTDN